ncbi:MAG: beta galactosidase jelly roll domain-containing protein [Salinivirgaceae bacterium]|jgi:hypothetical protein|nr:beta galactosidase jelly roll domain-containing protein [Salinivirgaceae bacterium]
MTNYLKISFRIIALVLLSLALKSTEVFSEELREIVNLEGRWKFSIGDNSEWSNAHFDDRNWENINVPNSWENEGYRDYNGYAWYRKSFVLERSINEEFVYLVLGYIDDADEVYLNGKQVGAQGLMQPKPETAYNIKRKYPVPVSLLNENGKNTIAVRVYDYYEDGGMVSGDIGLFVDRQTDMLEVDLSGYWGFETEPEMNERLKNKTPKTPNKIFVPASWESQGYNDFNGKARYNLQFKVSAKKTDEQLYLILGFIDDVETVYLNKEKIGSVFTLEDKEDTGLPYDIIFRGYKIPEGLLKTDTYNNLSVMVFDKGGIGGIYAGPIGIATKSNYEKLKNLNTRKRGFWEIFFNVYY